MENTLENRMTRVEVTLEHVATKEDLAMFKADLFKWFIGSMAVYGIALFGTISYFH